jgi:hypothetical protein
MFMISIVSAAHATRLAAFGYGIPWVRQAATASSAPIASLRSSRPSDSWSTVTARLASHDGWCEDGSKQ